MTSSLNSNEQQTYLVIHDIIITVIDASPVRSIFKGCHDIFHVNNLRDVTSKGTCLALKKITDLCKPALKFMYPKKIGYFYYMRVTLPLKLIIMVAIATFSV